MPPKKMSSYSKMYLVTPTVYDKLLKCLDEGDKKIIHNLNKESSSDQPLRPSEQILQNMTRSDITSESYHTVNELEPEPEPEPEPKPEPMKKKKMDNFLKDDLPDDIFDDEVNEWRESTPIPTELRPSSPVNLNWSTPAEPDSIDPVYINPLRIFPPPAVHFRPNPINPIIGQNPVRPEPILSPNPIRHALKIKKKPDVEPMIVSTHIGPPPPPPPPPSGVIIDNQPKKN
jgi:hypothetical protein